jgi:CheY-like chemotaxis protein
VTLQAALQTVASASIIPSGTETVLVVEDEEAIRRLIGRLLAARGYTVLEAPTGEEAIAVCDEHEGKIDLLLTDLELPEMSGRELAQRLRAIRGDMKLLYMSGHAARAIEDYGIFPEGKLFLPKPFTNYELAWRVREVLDAGT